MQLRTWQIPTAEKQLAILQQRGVALNASGTGVGKTYMGAWTAAQLGLPVLCICPKSVIGSWASILEEVGVESKVLNWEKIKTERYGLWKNDRWAFDRSYFIIVDEAHQGSTGPYSKISEMLAKLKAFPTLPKLLLSATIADSPVQMRATGFLFGLHGFQESAFWQWCLQMGCVRIMKPDGRGGQFPDICMPRAKAKADAVMLKIREALLPYMVRISPDEIPDFPQTEISAKLFDLDSVLTPEEKKVYGAKAAAHKTLSEDERAIMTIARQKIEITKVPILASMVKDIVSEGRSAVVFHNFREPMELMAMALGPQNVTQIHGGQSDSDRASAISRFQSNEINICLAQIQAGGVAVSLHDVHKARPRTALHCPNWDAKKTVQACGRIQRDGGTKSIQLFVLAKGTLEEGVYRAINRKRGNIDALNDGDFVAA